MKVKEAVHLEVVSIERLEEAVDTVKSFSINPDQVPVDLLTGAIHDLLTHTIMHHGSDTFSSRFLMQIRHKIPLIEKRDESKGPESARER